MHEQHNDIRQMDKIVNEIETTEVLKAILIGEIMDKN